MADRRTAPRCALRLLTLAVLAAAPGLPALAQPLVQGCTLQAISSCMYTSPNGPFTPAFVDTYVEDPARANHPVPLRVRYPLGATGARPVVIWSHGGTTTIVDEARTRAAGFTVSHGQQDSVRRSESFVRAGYVVIHVGRLQPRSLTQAQLQDCLNAGVIVGGIVSPDETALSACRTFTGFHRYGPLNVAFVAGLLSQYRVGMLPGFSGTLDRERIVVGGWSGGSESALNVAGAAQRWDARFGGTSLTQPPVAVPGVVAFFTDGPRGPDWAGYKSGFQEDSAYGIDARPILFNSARDDRSTGDGAAVARTSQFFGAAKGGKVLSWSWTPAAEGGPNHGTVDINDDDPAYDGCDTALRELHCRWLENLGVAFLDAAVRGLPPALAWMGSGNFKVLTGDRIELYLR